MRPIEDLDIDMLAHEVNRISLEKGFETQPEQADQKLLLAVGELVEAQNELRNGLTVTDTYYEVEGPDGFSRVFVNSPEEIPPGRKPEGFGIECADAVIRILQLMAAYDLPIRGLFAAKIAYNETRPPKHGKVF